MSYDAIERSNYDAVPSGLYEFTLDNKVFRYATGETDVVYNGKTYIGIPISDDGVKMSGDVRNEDLVITMARATDLGDLFVGTPPSEVIFVTVRRMNRGSDEAPVIWGGTLKSVRIKSGIEIEVVCRTLTATLNRNGLRLSWSRSCPHALYDRGCKVDPDDFAATAQVSALTGNAITATGLGALGTGYLAGGYFEFELMPDVIERRGIESHVGNTITVLGTTDGLEVADWITVYPGCDRVTSTCNSKFNNLVNYGGIPHLPTKSPFDGSVF